MGGGGGDQNSFIWTEPWSRTFFKKFSPGSSCHPDGVCQVYIFLPSTMPDRDAVGRGGGRAVCDKVVCKPILLFSLAQSEQLVIAVYY